MIDKYNAYHLILQPLVSIVTVSYNSADTIEQTIQSVTKQTYPNIEYIIIDGGSRDGTVEIIKRYQDKISFWISEPDMGIYDAMNKGISYAKGDYIGIINSDDCYELDAIEKIVSKIKEDPIIIYGNMMCEKEIPELVKPARDLSTLKKQMSIFHPSTFVKSDAYKKYGLFNIEYKISADWDMMLRLYENGCSFCYCDETIAHFRMSGISSNFDKRQIEERKRLRISHGNSSFLLTVKDILILIYRTVKKYVTTKIL